jgi:hypothetical protein
VGVEAGLLLAALISPSAHAADWRTSWDGALYGYAGETAVDVALAPPVNQAFHIAQRNRSAEARFNFKAESEALRISARPIVLAQGGTQNAREAYLSQWQLRLRAADTLSASVGRELLNWGPAQFRSPSSPFYFDNGRANPMRELSGMDAVKLSWTPDTSSTLAVARLTGSGHASVSPDPWRNTWLVKWDQRGADWAAGLAVAQSGGHRTNVGLHAQYTVSDAWLLYGEAGSGVRPGAVDTVLPAMLGQEPPRHSDVLLGAAYTFDSGDSLHAELLRHGHGLASALGQRAVGWPQTGQTAAAPGLLGRDTLHLVWQSNLMADGGTARLMATRGFDSGDKELAAYAERNLDARTALFAVALASESGGLVRPRVRSLTAGVKLALP